MFSMVGQSEIWRELSSGNSNKEGKLTEDLTMLMFLYQSGLNVKLRIKLELRIFRILETPLHLFKTVLYFNL